MVISLAPCRAGPAFCRRYGIPDNDRGGIARTTGVTNVAYTGATGANRASPEPTQTLRRDLGFWGTASLSVGGMAPTLAMSVTGVQAARLLGRAAPLAYVLAGVGFSPTWMLIGTYIFFPPVSVLGMAAFTQAFLKHTGVAASTTWLPIALVSWALVWLLVARGIK